MSKRLTSLDDYIDDLKSRDKEFAKEFDAGYADFKIGETIRCLRLESGMTQDEFAERLKTKKSVVSRMENHCSDIKLSTLRKIAAAFGKSIKIAVI